MKILVFHGSAGNFGDTAMLEGVVLNLLRNFPSVELFVAHRPGLRTTVWERVQVRRQAIPWLTFPSESALAGKRYFWRHHQWWWETTRKSYALLLGRVVSAKTIRVTGVPEANLADFCAKFDALHMVGGGYLTDTFPELLVEASCLALAFHEQGKPILLTGQQVGPFQSRPLRAHTRRILNCARFVGLREPNRSVELCQQLGLDPERFRVMGDDSFGLPRADDREVRACLSNRGLEPGRFLALNVRVGPYAAGHREYMGLIAQLADALSSALCLPVVLVPIAFNDLDSDDRSGATLISLMKQAQASRIDSRDLTPALVRGLLGKAFGAIGVSYHFCTFALSQGIPAVSLHQGDYYSQKASGICGFWQDRRLAIPLPRCDISSAAAHISSLFQDINWRKNMVHRAENAIHGWQTIFDEQVQNGFKPTHFTGSDVNEHACAGKTVQSAKYVQMTSR